MRQNVHEVIVLSNTVDSLDILLTMTYKPQSKAIIDALPPELQAANQPKFFAYPFCIKLQVIIVYIINKEVFVEVEFLVHVIEFQKHGSRYFHYTFF